MNDNQTVKIEGAPEEKPRETYTVTGTKTYTLELTEDEADFLDSKGPVFVDLWARRLEKGMKPVLRARFDEMVQEYSKTK